MANSVFANNMEISCKAGQGKSICAFPDVCFTPPENPATPPGVPIPYPNTGMDSDAAEGTKHVKISDKEVMLKNKSYFKTSTGDEAGAAAKKGIITSVNKGKVFFNAWSMDVKFEGENVVRNLDLTTHNHACPPGNTAPWPFTARMAMATGLTECDGDRKKVEDSCKIDTKNPKDMKQKPKCPSNKGVKDAEKKRTAAKKKAQAKQGATKSAYKKSTDYIDANKAVRKEYEKLATAVAKDDCQQALKCFLVPEKSGKCCPGQTPHHLIPASAIVEEGGRGKSGGENVLDDFPDYKSTKAPCICVEGPNADTATHKEAHAAWADYLSSLPDSKASLEYSDGSKTSKVSTISYEQACKGALSSAEAIAPHCDSDCLEAQINNSHLGNPEASKSDNKKRLRRTMERDDLVQSPTKPPPKKKLKT